MAEAETVVPAPDPDLVVGNLEYDDLREVGKDAVFTISTAKIGNGVEQLRDGNLETFWQSDGTAPHLINIQFPQKTSVSKVCLYMDFTVDESYTAKKVIIRAGTTAHDLVDVTAIELHKPVGWCQIRLHGSEGDMNDDEKVDEPLRTHLLQVRVLSMHQGGKDTHVRQICVLGPRPPAATVFRTVDMQQFASIR
jgi:anaphase-promoting complex subunit 10